MKLLRLVCELSKSKSRPVKSRNKKRKLGRKQRRKRPKRRRLNLRLNEPSLRQPGRENDNSNSSWKTLVTRPRTMMSQNRLLLKKAPQRQVKSLPARSPRRQRVLLLQNHLRVADTSQRLFQARPPPKNREIHISESSLSLRRMEDQPSPHLLYNRLNHSPLHLRLRLSQLICLLRILSTELLSRKQPNR